jgi:hypothetical protein
MKGEENFVRRNLKRKAVFKYKKSHRRSTGDANGRRVDDGTGVRGGFNPAQADVAMDVEHPVDEMKKWGLDPLSLSMGIIASSKPLLPVKLDKVSSTSPKEYIRGLHLQAKATTKPLDIMLHSSWSKNADDNLLALLEKHAPICSGHSMTTRIFTVRKVGSNRGRRFYSCCFPADQRCGYFLWAEVCFYTQ